MAERQEESIMPKIIAVNLGRDLSDRLQKGISTAFGDSRCTYYSRPLDNYHPRMIAVPPFKKGGCFNIVIIDAWPWIKNISRRDIVNASLPRWLIEDIIKRADDAVSPLIIVISPKTTLNDIKALYAQKIDRIELLARETCGVGKVSELGDSLKNKWEKHKKKAKKFSGRKGFFSQMLDSFDIARCS